MSFRHLSAVRTLNGRSDWRDKKWRFSVARISAPAHSVYAAMKASAGFNPFCSYLKTTSKGTTISSSTWVNVVRSSLNSWKASAEIFRFTSSNMVRGIRTIWRGTLINNLSKSFFAAGSFVDPKANMYSFESMTKRKFFLPDRFPGFPESFYDLILAHLKDRRRIFGDYLSKFIQMPFGLKRFFIHIYHLN